MFERVQNTFAKFRILPNHGWNHQSGSGQQLNPNPKLVMASCPLTTTISAQCPIFWGALTELFPSPKGDRDAPMPSAPPTPPPLSRVGTPKVGHKTQQATPEDIDLSVFNVLNIFCRWWFLLRTALLANVISAQKAEDRKITWVEFAPPFHSHLVKCTVALVPCPIT